MEEDEKPPLTGRTYKKINWLRAGILTADKLVTVSPNYATEISANPAGGVELDAAIRCVVVGSFLEVRKCQSSKRSVLVFGYLYAVDGPFSSLVTSSYFVKLVWF